MSISSVVFDLGPGYGATVPGGPFACPACAAQEGHPIDPTDPVQVRAWFGKVLCELANAGFNMRAWCPDELTRDWLKEPWHESV